MSAQSMVRKGTDRQTETSRRRTERAADGWSERQRGSERETEVWRERDRWGCRDEVKRDRAGNRGREGGVIIYQVFGCA